MSNEQHNQLWVDHPDGQTMCALINGDRGWLMYLRESGDAGFSSRNPDFQGSKSEMIDYVLSNGQQDSYPASWALPISVVNKALEYFEREGKPPPFVSWHNDSGDGAAIGDMPAPNERREMDRSMQGDLNAAHEQVKQILAKYRPDFPHISTNAGFSPRILALIMIRSKSRIPPEIFHRLRPLAAVVLNSPELVTPDMAEPPAPYQMPSKSAVKEACRALAELHAEIVKG